MTCLDEFVQVLNSFEDDHTVLHTCNLDKKRIISQYCICQMTTQGWKLGTNQLFLDLPKIQKIPMLVAYVKCFIYESS